MRNLLLTCVAAMALSAAASANATVIDFESGFAGGVATGHPELVFSTANGNGMQVGNFGSQGDGQSLLVGGDGDGNYVVGTFNDGTHTTLSLDFGNDDPGFTNPGDLATLRVFLGATFVGQSTVVLNRDDIMNQTISFSGLGFNNFTFAYTDAAGSPFTGGGNANTGLIEIIDNVTYAAGGGAVPEPATWALMISGFGLAGAALRRRRSVATVA